jgi:hypothetical protein
MSDSPQLLVLGAIGEALHISTRPRHLLAGGALEALRLGGRGDRAPERQDKKGSLAGGRRHRIYQACGVHEAVGRPPRSILNLILLTPSFRSAWRLWTECLSFRRASIEVTASRKCQRLIGSGPGGARGAPFVHKTYTDTRKGPAADTR